MFCFPGEKFFYTARCGDVSIPVQIACVDSVQQCGPRSNLFLVNFMWSTFVYYFVNHVTVVVPSHTAGDKLMHVRNYKAEIGDGDSWACCSFYGTLMLPVSFTLIVQCLLYVIAVSVKKKPLSIKFRAGNCVSFLL